MDRFFHTTVGAVLAILCPLVAQGQNTWYVDDDCTAPGTGSQADPFCAIQRGIDESVSGDEVIVAPGTYNETINFNGKAIEVGSSDGAAVTIIDMTGLKETVVRCTSGEPPETILRGFTVTGGNGFMSGGGMLISDSSPTVVECVFLKNRVFTFHSGSCCGGGMLIVRGSPMVVNCQFIGNVAEEALTCDGDGGGICIKNGSPVVTGCTFVANTASFGRGGAIYNDGGNLTVSNCILWGNTPDQISDNSTPSSVTFSDVQGGFPGLGNIDADPLFVDPDGADDIPGTMDDNLLLRSGSPAIDAGDNTAVPGCMTV